MHKCVAFTRRAGILLTTTILSLYYLGYGSNDSLCCSTVDLALWKRNQCPSEIYEHAELSSLHTPDTAAPPPKGPGRLEPCMEGSDRPWSL